MGGVTFIPFTRDPPAVRPKVDIKKPATDAAPAPGVCVCESVWTWTRLRLFIVASVVGRAFRELCAALCDLYVFVGEAFHLHSRVPPSVVHFLDIGCVCTFLKCSPISFNSAVKCLSARFLSAAAPKAAEPKPAAPKAAESKAAAPKAAAEPKPAAAAVAPAAKAPKAAPAPKEPNAAKEATPKEAKPAVAKPAAPAPSPAPAAAKAAGGAGAPTSPLAALNATLLTQAYVAGFSPSAADATEFAKLEGVAIDAAAYPNVARWFRNIGSFSPAQRAAFA